VKGDPSKDMVPAGENFSVDKLQDSLQETTDVNLKEIMGPNTRGSGPFDKAQRSLIRNLEK